MSCDPGSTSVPLSHSYSSGRTTGLVLDSGDGVTHSVPVFEGFSMPNAIRRIDLAGRDVTDRLQLLMRGAGYDMRTSAEKEVVRGLKEEGCYVRSASSANSSSSSSKDDPSRSTEEFKLPDGQVIKVCMRAVGKAKASIDTDCRFFFSRSSERRDIWHRKSSSTQTSLDQNIRACISWWWTVSIGPIWICGRACSATSSSVVARH